MNEQVMNVLSKKWVIPAAVGVTSFGSGLVAGYILGKRNGDVFEVSLEELEKIDWDPNQLEINFDVDEDEARKDAMVKHPSTHGGETVFTDNLLQVVQATMLDDLSEAVYAASEYTVEELEAEAEEMLEEDELEEALAEQAHQNLTNDEDSGPVIQNIWNMQDPAEHDDQWNYEDERSVRTYDAPYVISVDEYMADEAGCEQSTVTYYVGDDIMADEYDVPMYDFNGMMGPLKFGHGSNDSQAVYIRNEKMKMEWEVLRHSGRFDVEVRGYDVQDAYAKEEAKHSVPRFREE